MTSVTSKLQFLLNMSSTSRFRLITHHRALLSIFPKFEGKIYLTATRCSSACSLILDALTELLEECTSCQSHIIKQNVITMSVTSLSFGCGGWSYVSSGWWKGVTSRWEGFEGNCILNWLFPCVLCLCLIIWSGNLLPNLRIFPSAYTPAHIHAKYTLVHYIRMSHAILFSVLGKLREHCQACSQFYSVEAWTKITTEKQMQWPLKESGRSYFQHITKCYILKVLTLFATSV